MAQRRRRSLRGPVAMCTAYAKKANGKYRCVQYMHGPGIPSDSTRHMIVYKKGKKAGTVRRYTYNPTARAKRAPRIMYT